MPTRVHVLHGDMLAYARVYMYVNVFRHDCVQTSWDSSIRITIASMLSKLGFTTQLIMPAACMLMATPLWLLARSSALPNTSAVLDNYCIQYYR